MIMKLIPNYNELVEKATYETMDRLSEAQDISTATMVERFNNYHVAAFMDIDKTTNSLKSILELKKQATLKFIKCSNIELKREYEQIIEYTDHLIRKILGIEKL